MQTKITRTNRPAGISARIDSDGVVCIRAGYEVSIEEMQDFLNKHRRWVKNHVSRAMSSKEYNEKYKGLYTILLHGKATNVEYIESKGKSYYDGNMVHIYTLGDKMDALQKWLFSYAKQYLTDMFNSYTHSTVKVVIKRVKTYFGVCFRRKTGNYIVLNSELIHADDDCIMYVIKHELTHLVVPNHSKAFYDELAKHEPRHIELKARLRDTVRF